MVSEDSSKIIGVTDTARILGVSTNTVRRLAENGKLKFTTVKNTNYRRFLRSDVVAFKNEFYVQKNVLEKDDVIKPFSDDLDDNKAKSGKQEKLKNLNAKAHPAHYLMHKYWGRKSHSVIAEYIQHYTSVGDVVLDPFMGSGIVPIEAAKHSRYGIGVDINPISHFIVQNTVSKLSLDDFESTSQEILSSLSEQWGSLYKTKCPFCENVSSFECAVWDHGILSRLRGRCNIHGIFVKDADKEDNSLLCKANEKKLEMDKMKTISYPKDKVFKYVKRSGKESIDELFSSRALIILSSLRQKISEVTNPEIKNLLFFAFSSMLPNVSNMLPGDLKTGSYKSGWVISKFWTPKIHTERNIFHCFNLRIKAILKGKIELQDLDESLITPYNGNSNNLSSIDDESIDYIFTDPPYGESIAYLALSHFWNSWLFEDVDYENEIIIDNYRNKNYADYDLRILKSFQEMYRVLKDKHYLSFTFHNRDLKIWKGVMDAVKNSGFILHHITLQDQAVSSGTQGINRNNTLTGDFVYTLYKDNSRKPNFVEDVYSVNAKEYILAAIESIINHYNGITPSRLYENLIPIIVENEMYVDETGNIIDIEKILNENYEYVETDRDNEKGIGNKYKWQVKN